MAALRQPAAGCGSRARTSAGWATSCYADGIKVSGTDSEILVNGKSGEDIGRLIAEHQLVVSELSPVGASLEDIFFELTGVDGRPVMTRLIGAELFKMRTTRTFYGARRQLARAWSCCSTIPSARSSDFQPDEELLDRPAFFLAGLLQVFTLLLGILTVTNEFRHGTITPSLLVVPNRATLMLAKLVGRAARSGWSLGLLTGC